MLLFLYYHQKEKNMKVIYSNGNVGEALPEEELHILRHTAAHIMAQAIRRLYPEAADRCVLQ